MFLKSEKVQLTKLTMIFVKQNINAIEEYDSAMFEKHYRLLVENINPQHFLPTTLKKIRQKKVLKTYVEYALLTLEKHQAEDFEQFNADVISDDEIEYIE